MKKKEESRHWATGGGKQREEKAKQERVWEAIRQFFSTLAVLEGPVQTCH